MKKYLPIVLCAFACSCGSKGTDVAALPSESFVATAGPIPIALQHKLTDDDLQRLHRFYPKTLERIREYRPLYMQDIINMTRAGVSDDVIIHEMRVTRSSFYLTPQNEQTLEQAGVSRRVINEMMDTAVDRY